MSSCELRNVYNIVDLWPDKKVNYTVPRIAVSAQTITQVPTCDAIDLLRFDAGNEAFSPADVGDPGK